MVEPVDPWTLTSADEFADAAAAGVDAQRALALEVGHRNAAAIRSCTLLAAYLEGQEPDSGTVVEVGYACGLRPDLLRPALGSAPGRGVGVALNLQVESLIVASGGEIVGSLAALVAALDRHAGAVSSQAWLD